VELQEDYDLIKSLEADILAISTDDLSGAAFAVDGLGLEFGTWRFNLRKSNTEPVIRLNVESKGDIALMEQKTEELLSLIRAE